VFEEKSLSDTCLSLIVPCFNEEAALPLFYTETSNALAALENSGIEFIFVDDGSKDNTLSVLRNLAAQDSRVHYISFSRNFGKEAAMLAGLQAARGEYAAMLDADLQHPPSLIPQMYEAIISGEYDCAAAIRTRKGDSPVRTFFARCFYRLTKKLSGIEIIDGAGDFRLMTRRYVEAIISLAERSRFSKGIYPWVGFKTKWIKYENVDRVAGNTKWSMSALFAYSLDGIIAFSTKLLGLASIAGILSFGISLLLFVLLVIRKLFWGVSVDGWTTIVCFIVLFGGLILMGIGILGQYLAKIYTEVKQRPHYIVKEEK
jgi:glycosyltransferase involved in cell wall biosynthesis